MTRTEMEEKIRADFSTLADAEAAMKELVESGSILSNEARAMLKIIGDLREELGGVKARVQSGSSV